MSAVSSALSTLSLEGYSLSIPDSLSYALILALLFSFSLLCIRLFKSFREQAKCQIESDEENL